MNIMFMSILTLETMKNFIMEKARIQEKMLICWIILILKKLAA